MIGRLCLGLTMPFLVGAGQDALPKDWGVFSPQGSGFTIAVPGKPVQGKRTVRTPAGEVEVTFYLVEVKGQGSYLVTFTDFPEVLLKGGTDDKRLDNARDGAVQTAKGKLKLEKRISLEGFAGRELIIESEATGGVRTRIYAVKNRLYQTIAAGSRVFFQTKETGQFFESFKLVK